jgi:probable HAF family extracellular repeat protein
MPVTAGAGTLTTFSVPSAATTRPSDINNAGTIAGTFERKSPYARRSFLRSRSGKYTLFDAPNSTWTWAKAINSKGAVAGNMWDSINQGSRVFVRGASGKFTVHEIPGGKSISVEDINDGNQVTGYFSDSANKLRGFVLASNGTITVFDADVNAVNTIPAAINSSGEITGSFRDAVTDRVFGFVRSPTGTIKVFDADPALISTTPTSMNAGAQIAGCVHDASHPYGFLRSRAGNFIFFEVPGSSETIPSSINAAGAVTGTYSIDFSSLLRGFVRWPNGRFDKFAVNPSRRATYPVAINDKGEVVGYSEVDSSNFRGFLWKP